MKQFPEFLNKHRMLVISLVTVGIILALATWLKWWEVLGLLILKFGLGIKVKGATTVAATIAKSGGKKALLITTTGVLIKRHVIDLGSKFFAEHSIARYKKNIVLLIKYKIKKIMQSSRAQKIKLIFKSISVLPAGYFVWAKLLGTALQKTLYALVAPVIAILWDFALQGLNFFTGIVTFIMQIAILNIFIERMYNNRFGIWVIKWVTKLFEFLGCILEYLNRISTWMGFDPKHTLVTTSLKFNRYLEGLIYKDNNSSMRLKFRREVHKTSREKLIIERAQQKEQPISLVKQAKEKYRIYVSKNLTYKERRKKRQLKKEKKQTRSIYNKMKKGNT